MSVGYGRAFASYAGPQKKPVIDGSLLREISEVACLENQACARKVALAAAIWDSCVHQTVQIGEHIMDAGNYAASETAKARGCSKTGADTLADVGPGASYLPNDELLLTRGRAARGIGNPPCCATHVLRSTRDRDRRDHAAHRPGRDS